MSLYFQEKGGGDNFVEFELRTFWI